jgi:hypothetical protein
METPQRTTVGLDVATSHRLDAWRKRHEHIPTRAAALRELLDIAFAKASQDSGAASPT